jgi:hypothetical protein
MEKYGVTQEEKEAGEEIKTAETTAKEQTCGEDAFSKVADAVNKRRTDKRQDTNQPR